MAREHFVVTPFFDEATSTLTYVVHDPATRDAVIIDPVLDYDPVTSQTSTESIERLVSFARGAGLRVHWVLETHAHADHLSGAQLLRQRFSARLAIGERITEVQALVRRIYDLPPDFPVDGRQFDRRLADGEQLDAGSLAVRAIATPGHTAACLSYRIGDHVFTGDALFIEDYGTGRCDFPGGSPLALWNSITERLYALPAETRVHPCHDYRPGGRALRWDTSIGEEKRCNVQLDQRTPCEAFLALRRQRDAELAPPRLLHPSLQVNAAGGRLPPPHANGRRYLTIPLNARRPTGDAGA